ncbi:MAG TPA: DegT/DnrJ/EryC1/StrS family aminotransferase [Bryobacteraceae bacterium]|jgi:dTDP-4-amino-4,6-dideoxygalactose transaminase
MLAIGFDIPIRGASWSLAEYGEVLGGVLAGGSRFEDEQAWLRQYLENTFGGHAILFNSGRSALDVALGSIAASRTKPGPASVLVPSLVCRAVPEKIALNGMRPVFYDVRPDMIPCEGSMREACLGDTVAAVYPYLYGKVGGIGGAAEFCKTRGLSLIEDCAAAFLLPDEMGALAGTTGDHVVFSFQEGKTVVAGSGGALVTRSADAGGIKPTQGWTRLEEWRLSLAKVPFVIQKIWRSTGYAIERLTGEPLGRFSTRTQDQVRPISGIDARLVRQQIPNWKARMQRKIEIISRYARNLEAYPSLKLPQHSAGQFVGRLFVQFPQAILRRADDQRYESRIVKYIREQGIQTQLSYYPAHRLTQFAGSTSQPLPCTESLYQSIIELPTQIDLRDDAIDRVSETLMKSAGFLQN